MKKKTDLENPLKPLLSKTSFFETDLFYLSLSSIVLFIYFLPYFILGENSYIHIHDNLDANVSWYHAVTKLPYDESSGILPQLMNGTPLRLLPWKLNGVYQVFNIFPTFDAYVMNEILVRVIGLVSMTLLLSSTILKKKSKILLYSISTCFSLLPIYPIYGLSALGTPLILYSFINLYKKKRELLSIILIVTFCFYSSLFLVGLFVTGYALLYIFYDFLINRRLERRAVIGLFTLIMAYSLFNWPLIQSLIFNTGFQSHRLNISVPLELNFLTNINTSLKYLFHGHYHAVKMTSLLILALVSITFVHIFYNFKKGKSHKRDLQNFIFINIPIALNFIFITTSPYIKFLISLISPEISKLNIERFYFLTPLFLFISLAYSLQYISNNISKRVAYGLLVFQLTLCANAVRTAPQGYFSNFLKIIKADTPTSKPTFSQFYATDLFEEISSKINQNKQNYRVLSIGLHPSIALYNGFFTLDGYMANYSLDYKNKFRMIIKDEINKSSELLNYYDKWGSRCYAYSSELGKNLTRHKDLTPPISNLSINIEIFSKLNGQYIFSSTPILNSDALKLKLIQVFEDRSSYWRIYLYQTINSK